MSRFVAISDFKTGSTRIATTQYSEDDLQSYLDDHEALILQDLLGCKLYDELIADYDAIPVDELTEERLIKIYNPFCLDYELCTLLRSDGINSMLVHLIYFTFLSSEDVQQRVEGFGRGENENSERIPVGLTSIFTKYNRGIKTYKAIQSYICLNPDDYDYENYKGIDKDFASWL